MRPKIHFDLPSSKDTRAYQRAMRLKLGNKKQGKCECGFTGEIVRHAGEWQCPGCVSKQKYAAGKLELRRTNFPAWWRRFGPDSKYLELGHRFALVGLPSMAV